jgi:hypothetical protein
MLAFLPLYKARTKYFQNGCVQMKYINVREYRNGNQKRTIKKNWQHRFTQDEGKQNKNNPEKLAT